jgi:DNA ligase-1
MTELRKEKILDCLRKLSLRSGFVSLENFVKYKERMCSEEYAAVYPEIQIISTTNEKVYVDNLKVMTAQNLYDAKTGSMVKFNDKTSQQLKISEPPINWWASEKWDGIRALWDGEKMISRGSGVGKPKVYTYIPEWFKRSLPPSIPLDGEIWIGRGLFQKTSRLSTLKPGKSYSQEQIDNIWTGLEDPQVIFKVFDIPNDPRPFEERMKLLQTIVKDQKECWKKLDYMNKKTFPIQFTEQVKIKSMEQLVSLYKKMTSEGAEGIMLRAPGSQYETKRSKYMLKYKIKEDAECIVRDYTLGEGRLKGLLGSLKCEIIQDSKASGIFTQIGTGFTDSQRTNYNKKGYSEYVPIGSIVSFSYMEMTDDGVPRHPVYRGIRDDIEAPKQKVSIAHVKQILNKIMNKIVIEKGQNWSFKVKFYKQALEILKDDSDLITLEDYIKELRKGGMLLKDEESFKAKNGTWKSTILQKIDLILKTGTVDDLLVELESIAIENFSRIPGIGPSGADKLYKDHAISTIQELRDLYSRNKKVLNDKQAIGLVHYEDLQKRISRSEMNLWNEILVDTFNKTTQNGTIQLAGSYRREKTDSGDIDVLISTPEYDPRLMDSYYNNLIKEGIITKKNTISKGNVKIMAIGKIDEHYRHIDIFYYTKDVYPFALLFTTGSKEHNVNMRAHALKKGYSLSERNLTHGTASGRPVSKEEYLEKIQKEYPETEEDIFKFLEYKYVLPKNR